MPAAVTPASDPAGAEGPRPQRPRRGLRQLRRALVLGTAVTALSTALAGGAGPASATDDYPWRTAADGAVDPWGFTMRQCVSWTAFKLAQRGAPLDNRRGAWGSAADWDDAARRLGHGIGGRPVVGSIAHWNAGERSAWFPKGSRTANGLMRAGGAGHVGYVTGVHPDGSAVVQQYNGNGSRSYSVVRVRAPRYLYLGVTAPV